jgi:short-subunit dehydrogenase
VLCPGKTATPFDFNAGNIENSNSNKANVTELISYTIKQLNNDKTLIIPGLKNKIKYYTFKFLPEFITDFLIKSI